MNRYTGTSSATTTPLPTVRSICPIAPPLVLMSCPSVAAIQSRMFCARTLNRVEIQAMD